LNELSAAVNQAVAESDKVAKIIARIRAENYDVFLALETTVNANPAWCEQRSNPPGRGFSSGDVDFLKALRIKVED
jgi:hypothetical protein